MKVLTKAEMDGCVEALRRCSPEIDYVQGDGDGLYFTNPEAACITVEYPAKLEQLPFFVHRLATLGYEDVDFGGGLVWIHGWGVWNSFEEGIGYRVLEKINAAAGQPRSFEETAGYHFRADELCDTIGLLMQPMVFAWDAFYLPSWTYGGCSQFFLHISHDSVVDVVTRTKDFHDRVFEQLEKFNLNPKSGSQNHRNRFCRATAT